MRQESHRCDGIVLLKLEEVFNISQWQNLSLSWEKDLINLGKAFHSPFHGYLGHSLGCLLLEGKSVRQGVSLVSVFSLASKVLCKQAFYEDVIWRLLIQIVYLLNLCFSHFD